MNQTNTTTTTTTTAASISQDLFGLTSESLETLLAAIPDHGELYITGAGDSVWIYSLDELFADAQTWDHWDGVEDDDLEAVKAGTPEDLVGFLSEQSGSNGFKFDTVYTREDLWELLKGWGMLPKDVLAQVS